MSRLFITGTNTDVGKTVIARAIVRAFSKQNKKVVALKPVESGVKQGDLCSDTQLLAKAGNQAKPENLYSLKEPLSPHLAAKLQNVKIDEEKLLDFMARKNLGDIVIAEGAGGLLVPIGDSLYGDIVAKAGYKLLIVTPNVLGCINSTLLTIEAARKRNIEICGFILNNYQGELAGNAEAITEYGKIPFLGYFPKISLEDELLCEAATSNLKLELLLG